MAASLQATVTLPGGKRQTFSEEVHQLNENHYAHLRASLKKVQEDVNKYLTEQIEQEKLAYQTVVADSDGGGNNTTTTDDSEDEGISSGHIII